MAKLKRGAARAAEAETTNQDVQADAQHANEVPAARTKKRTAKTANKPTFTEVVQPPDEGGTVPEAATPRATRRRSKPTAVGTATVADAFEGYLQSLDEAGKSSGTIASYRMELALAADELGAETPMGDLKPDRVLLFFGSDRVLRTRSGRAKSQLTIDKTRRVVRQALVWAEKHGLVAEAPLPELAASH